MFSSLAGQPQADASEVKAGVAEIDTTKPNAKVM